MGYVVAAIAVVLIVAAGVTLFVLNATRRQRRSSAVDSDHGQGTPGSEAAIVAPDDDSPVGSTDQHSGEQAAEGGRIGGGTAGGEGGLGGEAEGSRGDLADAERHANRPR
jgi:hypothetical protein